MSKQRSHPEIPKSALAAVRRAVNEHGQPATAKAIGITQSGLSRILSADNPTVRSTTLEQILAFTNGHGNSKTPADAISALPTVIAALEPLDKADRERVIAMAQLWLTDGKGV